MKKIRLMLLMVVFMIGLVMTGCDMEAVIDEIDKDPQKVIDKIEKESGTLPEESETKEWAIMIYGSVDIEPQLEKALLQELVEMVNIGNCDGDIHMVAQIDFRNAKWIPSKRYYIRKDEMIVRGSYPNMNMGDPRTFQEFMRWAMEYPAKHRMLYVLGHGTGWISLSGPGSITEGLRGLDLSRRDQLDTLSRRDQLDTLSRRDQLDSVDMSALRTTESFYPSVLYPSKEQPLSRSRDTRSFAYDHTQEDCLTLVESSRVLDRVLGGRKIDVLAFRSCLMNQLETAYQFSKHFDYLVATQTSQFGVAEGIATAIMGVNNIGFDPTVLRALKNASGRVSPRDMARNMFTSIKNTNYKIVENVPELGFSAQAIDLRAIRRALNPLTELTYVLRANLLHSDTERDITRMLMTARANSVKFGGLFEGMYDKNDPESDYEYIDLGMFMNNIAGMNTSLDPLLRRQIRDNAQQVEALLQRALIDRYSNIYDFDGVRSGGVTSIFMFPGSNDSLVKAYYKLMADKYRALDFNRETGWHDLLNHYYKKVDPYGYINTYGENY
ncbi:MAG: clostripain-related cysteine peptidase, partial [Candidatus Muiribacteriaceae bacterium]